MKPPKKPPAETRRRFQKWVDAAGGPSAAAVALNCDRVTVHTLLNGSRGPGMEIAARIEVLSKIPMRDWVDLVETATVTIKKVV